MCVVFYNYQWLGFGRAGQWPWKSPSLVHFLEPEASIRKFTLGDFRNKVVNTITMPYIWERISQGGKVMSKVFLEIYNLLQLCVFNALLFSPFLS